MTDYNEQAPLVPIAEMVPGQSATESTLGAIAAATTIESVNRTAPNTSELLVIADMLVDMCPESQTAKTTANTLRRSVRIIRSLGRAKDSDTEDPVDVELCNEYARRYANGSELTDLRYSLRNPMTELESLFD